MESKYILKAKIVIYIYNFLLEVGVQAQVQSRILNGDFLVMQSLALKDWHNMIFYLHSPYLTFCHAKLGFVNI